MGIGRTIALIGASFVGVFGGHMLIRSIFGSGSRSNQQRPQQQQQVQRMDPLEALKYYDLGTPNHRGATQGGYTQTPQPQQTYQQPAEAQYRSTVTFGSGNDGNSNSN